MVFAQIASPSRSRIPRYRALQEEVREAVRALNEDLGERGWEPIVYRERHHDHIEIRRWYRAADFCMVTSLHDGIQAMLDIYAETGMLAKKLDAQSFKHPTIIAPLQ